MERRAPQQGQPATGRSLGTKRRDAEHRRAGLHRRGARGHRVRRDGRARDRPAPPAATPAAGAAAPPAARPSAGRHRRTPRRRPRAPAARRPPRRTGSRRPIPASCPPARPRPACPTSRAAAGSPPCRPGRPSRARRDGDRADRRRRLPGRFRLERGGQAPRAGRGLEPHPHRGPADAAGAHRARPRCCASRPPARAPSTSSRSRCTARTASASRSAWWRSDGDAPIESVTGTFSVETDGAVEEELLPVAINLDGLRLERAGDPPLRGVGRRRRDPDAALHRRRCATTTPREAANSASTRPSVSRAPAAPTTRRRRA